MKKKELLDRLAHCQTAFRGRRSDIGRYVAVRIPFELWEETLEYWQ